MRSWLFWKESCAVKKQKNGYIIFGTLTLTQSSRPNAVALWRAVEPVERAWFTFAFASKSALAHVTKSPQTATHREVLPLLSTAFGSAPPARRALTFATLFSPTAACRDMSRIKSKLHVKSVATFKLCTRESRMEAHANRGWRRGKRGKTRKTRGKQRQ